MATSAHCVFCFETLFATLEHRRLPELSTVEWSWDRFCHDMEPMADENEIHMKEDERSSLKVIGDEEGNAKDLSRRRSQFSYHDPSTQQPSSKVQSSGSRSPCSTPSLSPDTPASTNESPISMSSSRTSLSIAQQHSEEPRNNQTVTHDSPLFVTWNTITRSGSKRLRGCIGTFEAQELDHGLRTYALTSALEDVRFAPIDLRELPSLECAVTLLTDFETATSPFAWEIGKHGLRISFTHHSRRYGATYLPDVAQEQGWTKTETLISLMRKAGWRGRDGDWQRVANLNVVRYQGRRVSLAYKDWRAWHDSVMEG